MSSDRDIRVLSLSDRKLADYAGALTALEADITYPFGGDRFRIDHGADYFAFFRRLGRLRYLVAERHGELVGAAAAVERTVPGGPAWYIADFKAVPGGGVHVARALSDAIAELPGPKRLYGISMNPAGEAMNRFVALVRRRRPSVEIGGILFLYALSADAMRRAAPILEAVVGPIRYVSLAGRKDIVLESTGAPIPLVHVQHGACAEPGETAPIEGCEHMFCIPAGPLLTGLSRLGYQWDASATILQFGMADTDWSFVLTSDI